MCRCGLRPGLRPDAPPAQGASHRLRIQCGKAGTIGLRCSRYTVGICALEHPIGARCRRQRSQYETCCAGAPKVDSVCLHCAIMIDLTMNIRTNPCQPRLKTLRQRLVAGFTLIELMVVVVIIGVLAALIVPNVLERAEDARITAARTDVNNLMQQLKIYKLDNQRYPTAAQGLQALLNKPTDAPIPPNWKHYVDKLPNDPWGHPYQYLNPGVRGEVDVISFGADGVAGGEGKNADIGSWE